MQLFFVQFHDLRQMDGGRIGAALTLHTEFLSAFFQPTDLVAQPAGFLIRLFVDRLQQLFAQMDQLRLRLLVLRQTARRFAAVLGFAVNVLQQRYQLVAEHYIVMRTTEPPGVAEIDELYAADVALPIEDGRLAHFLAVRSLPPAWFWLGS